MTAAQLQRRVRRLEKALRAVLAEDHHWCTEDQWTDTYGYLTCSCGKNRRDQKIRDVLDGKDMG